MRVISGKCRGTKLVAPSGTNTRPTTDRIKETLFNMIQYDIYDSVFLDLFAGSGAIGIEALSRGAKESIFIENNLEAIKCIKENLRITKLDSLAQVIHKDAVNVLIFPLNLNSTLWLKTRDLFYKGASTDSEFDPEL